MEGEILGNAVNLSIVLGFIGGVFSYFVLRPLSNAISELRVMVQELRKDLRDCEERRHMMELRVAEIDQRARSAHHRIDDLVEHCHIKHGEYPIRKERTGNDLGHR